MIAFLEFEAQGMLTSSLRHTARVFTFEGNLSADITCCFGGGHDAWYDLLEAVPEEIRRSDDHRRQVEFLQDVLLSMSDTLRTRVTGIRHDQHGLLDFLLDREEQFPLTPPPTLDVTINGARHQYTRC